MNDPAMLSEITRTSMSSFHSSQAVRRAPWRKGRVSSARTPQTLPVIDRGPNYSKRCAIARGGKRAGIAVREDCAGIGQQLLAELAHSLIALDIFVLDCQSLSNETVHDFLAIRGVVAISRNSRFIRSIAQNKFTAVGRVEANVSVICLNSSRSPAIVSVFESRTPKAMPIAAATPIAGAPRTTMTRMASANLLVALKNRILFDRR
jgi:hypothetical protein